jgi:hypothetical protein
MKLSKFIAINESKGFKNKATLIYEALVDNIQSAHYEQREDMIIFNVGKATSMSAFTGLDLIIKKCKKPVSGLARRKSTGGYLILLCVTELPNITDMQSFLEKSNISTKLINGIRRYMELGLDDRSNDSFSTDYEKNKHYNTSDVFEKMYQKIVKEIRSKVEEMERVISSFEKQKEETGNPSRKATLTLAIDKLKEDYLGTSFRDFMKKVNNIIEEIDSSFMENLDKENKKLLESRLKQLYEKLSN